MYELFKKFLAIIEDVIADDFESAKAKTLALAAVLEEAPKSPGGFTRRRRRRGGQATVAVQARDGVESSAPTAPEHPLNAPDEEYDEYG